MWQNDKYEPGSGKTPELIWRYLDIWKFLSLVQRRALYFVRLERLREVDPYEGAPPAVISPEDPTRDALDCITARLRQYLFVSCWHLNENQSMAMWKLYGGLGSAVAIQSTLPLLHECLQADKRFEIGIHRVRYEEYVTIPAEETPCLIDHPGGTRKRTSFEHEMEIRAIFVSEKPRGDGEFIGVDLNRLIERVYLAPMSSDWQLELLKGLLAQYNIVAPIVQSPWDDLR